MKLLVDECLSPQLTKMSQTAGYGESSHIVWLGKSGWKDWELKPLILDGDWTFVTKNSVDFRGSAANPGSKGQYSDVALHAGLICLNGPDTMDLAMQVELFEQALGPVTNNIGRQRFEFNEAARSAILSGNIPRNKPLNIMLVGSPRSLAISEQVVDFLRVNGFQIGQESSAMMVMPVHSTPFWYDGTTLSINADIDL